MFSGLLFFRNMNPAGSQILFNVPGLEAPVKVYVDDVGVPHIYAQYLSDLVFVQGYIQAQDRLFQMDVMRRVVQGTLSQIFGPSLITQDEFLRAIGLQRAATFAYEQLNVNHSATLNIIQRYVDGANYYIATHRGNLPLEYSLLALNGLEGYTVPYFNATDVLGMAGVLSAELTLGEMWAQIARYKVITTFGWQNASDLFSYQQYPNQTLDPSFLNMPKLDYVGASPQFYDGVAPDSSQADPLPAAASGSDPSPGDVLSQIFSALDFGGGSNNYVVAGSHTNTGYPMIENDPHLGTSTPSIWHQYQLCAADVGLNVTGVTLPLMPLIAIGHNAQIAWSITASYVDVVSDYSINESADGTEYLYNGTWEPFLMDHESIPVLGEKPFDFTVKIAPELGPVLNVDGYRVAVKWTNANSSTVFLAIEKLNLAKDYADFQDAMKYWDSPTFNFVYADLNGVIACWVVGKIPIRPGPSYGVVPMDGSNASNNWNQYLSFNDLPHEDNIEDPSAWYFVTANARVASPTYNATYLSPGFDEPFRQDRIAELIQDTQIDGGKMTFDDMRSIQQDILSPMARDIMSNVTSALAADPTDFSGVIALLSSWNFEMAGNSSAASIWHYFFQRFYNYTFDDEFSLYKGPVSIQDDMPNAMLNFPSWNTFINMVQTNCSHTQHYWFDNISTPGVNETMGDVIREAMNDTLNYLKQATGSSNFSNWNWDRFQTIDWVNQLAAGAGGSLNFLNNGPYPWESDSDCVECGDPFWRPSMIFVCEVSPGWYHASLVNGPGESGNIMSPYYNSEVNLYLHHEPHMMPFSTKDVLGNCTLMAQFYS